ncbi:MAG: PIN domain-containing protein, partial [Promethearchaeota archaeon]
MIFKRFILKIINTIKKNKFIDNQIKKIIIDTNIIIKHFKGDEIIGDWLMKIPKKCVTIITLLELYEKSSERGKKEIEKIKIYYLTPKSSKISKNLMTKYTPGQGLKTKDALIAGVCFSKNLKLFTLDKDFNCLI